VVNRQPLYLDPLSSENLVPPRLKGGTRFSELVILMLIGGVLFLTL